jgi:hypothetical protein
VLQYSVLDIFSNSGNSVDIGHDICCTITTNDETLNCSRFSFATNTDKYVAEGLNCCPTDRQISLRDKHGVHFCRGGGTGPTSLSLCDCVCLDAMEN